jgi:chromosome segregation ATPase
MICPHCKKLILDILEQENATLTQTIEAQRGEIDRLNKKSGAMLNLIHSVEDSRPLCPNCRDKQRGKPCLACTIDTLRAEINDLKNQVANHKTGAYCSALERSNYELRTQLQAAKNENAKLRECLEELEWSGGNNRCPMCRQMKPDSSLARTVGISDYVGHKPDCELRGTLKGLEGKK